VERFPYDSVLVLGFLIEPTGALTQTLHGRVARAVEHYFRRNTSTLVMLGGQADHEPFASAEAMRNCAIRSSVPSGDVVAECNALDTVGEAVFTRLLLPRSLPGRRFLVVTNEFHARRAAMIFRFVFGPEFEVEVDAIPNGPKNETRSAIKEEESGRRFCELFEGISAGDIRLIADRFWERHLLYQDARFSCLRRSTSNAVANL
jgi:hypothetical protein